MKDISKNKKSSDKSVNTISHSKGGIEVNRNINPDIEDIDIEDIFDVMGCKTRRDIINLLKDEPMFVSEISSELNIGQKAIIAHLRAMEEMGILNSSYKKIMRGRPRKYYDLEHDVTINVTINKIGFEANIPEDLLLTPQLPSGDEWSKLLEIEKKIDNGQLEAIEELKNQIRLYSNLKERAEYILERTLKNR
ncbi:MAG: ArsR family transcriptional regulator [Methanobrevibacter sp.]|uniref:ArsR/SmtB family transcription factor n=1 Tax=Methanobrevibacter sp. TaxID=66852 RepID=UPI0026DF04EA|nr:ArsR family transcriptional regulator [Methanobrevibacter sp.]MDO5848043.1 ArsR family transcriptional regulator [Methanobrevibacter sp.]